MGLFHRRYLCIFAFLFLFCSFGATFLSGQTKLTISILLSLAIIGTVIAIAINKKYRFALLCVFFCFAFSTVAIFNSYIFISRPQEQANKYEGEYSVELQILDNKASYKDASEYEVRVKQIGENSTNIKAYLYCDFASEMSFGDRIIAFADITANDYYTNRERSLLLILNVDDSQPVLYKEAEVENYFSLDGVGAVFNSIRKGFVGYVDSLFGADDGALVKGMLINDKSGLSSKAISDFRRAGVSHLLAVSGVHISLLLGALELLLRKLMIPKKARCITVAVFGVLLLALSGFSPSAVRSVLMLFAVYLSFMLYDDNDSITSLFFAAFFITLVSPYSVYELGMWMSFFATLGLVSVYPYLERRFRCKKERGNVADWLKRFGVLIIKLSLITIVANFFLLPILWYFFGEISLVSILTNLALSPITAVYLPLSAIALVFGKIPFASELFVGATAFVGRVLLYVIEFFAGIPGAVMSLRFPFVTILVVLFCISFAILLVVRLKRKLLICIPPIVFSVAFAICFCIFSFTAKPELKYVTKKDSDFLLIERCTEVTVCDISNASSVSSNLIQKNISPYSTEIENYIVTHVHKSYVYSIERILRSFYIRNLYLPLTQNTDELVIVKKIYDIAQQYNINVVFYESGKEIRAFSNIEIIPFFDEIEEKDGHSSVHITVEINGERLLTYSDASDSVRALEQGAKSRYFLLGEHGAFRSNTTQILPLDDTAIIIPSANRAQSSNTVSWDTKRYVMQSNKWILPLS